MDKFLEAALDEARKSRKEGGVPIGAVLVYRDKIIGRGHNPRVQKGSPILHAEMDALENAGRQTAKVYRESLLYTTLSPCAMCSGAIVLYRIPHVVVGEHYSFMGEEDWLRSHGVIVEIVDEKVIRDNQRWRKLAKERSGMEELAEVARKLKKVEQTIADNQAVIKANEDPELVELGQAEMDGLEAERAQLDERFQVLLVPPDPADEKNTIMELRAGKGGEESALFVGDLMRMYTRYIERRGWKLELLSSSESGKGGFKEVILLVNGNGAYGTLKFESGVHRVQRVPETEASGRIHTSAASVAVLPEAEDVDIHIEEKELKIDVFRSSGPGGQSVNTTDSAVRVTHLPTGVCPSNCGSGTFTLMTAVSPSRKSSPTS